MSHIVQDDESEAMVSLIQFDPTSLDEISRSIRSMAVRVKIYHSIDQFLENHDADSSGCALAPLLPGSESIQMLRAVIERCWSLPLIFVAPPRSNLTSAVRLMRLGAVDVLGHPINLELLQQRVKEAIHLDAERRTQARFRLEANQRISSLTPRER